ncbi:RagB/SusD family nutrient uptake outer membrane protein [Pedobacter gandavensis]|uniref:RagB/SusD family nutrient uptake outer membrane protein n=1 Tax=Pedobacter gandavensis TaxID=2679963 RepID=UPI002479CE56|nr:RagB/SusD family nutrient uptake outer membrane protein [Pedobacter gandavensis]WGQ11234.1 RagB/SusD family nutrient uptake outer membrane protein [Pedobacter gandavensis]
MNFIPSKYTTTIILAGLLSMSSCKKDFLDRKPLNLISEASLWEDPELIKLSVNEFYNFMNSGFTATYLPAAITDDIQVIGSEESKISGYLTGDFNATTFPQKNLWKDSYAQIRKINYFLERAETAPVLNPAQRKEMLGQARFFRAFVYFQLFSSFKEVPLLLKAQPVEEAQDKPFKTSQQDGMTFIAAELAQAAEELPASWTNTEYGRITSAAAQAFQSRVLLWAASALNNPANSLDKWQAAADAAKKVMNTAYYSLQADYNDPFLKKNVLVKPEVILEFRYNGLKGEKQHSFDKNNSPAGYGGKGTNAPTQEIVDEYEMKNGKMIGESGSGYLASDPYAGRDPRFEKSVLYNNASFKGRAVETFTKGKDMPTSNPTPTGFYIRKFIAEDFDYNKDVNVTSSTNWVIMRYAEVLLNYAEAQNEANGPDATVYQAINDIRKRAKMPELPTGLSQPEMRAKIRHERRIELAFEDQTRYNDLRRWKEAANTLNKSVNGVTITKATNGSLTFASKKSGSRVFTDKNYWQPIPLTEIATNPNLKPQNEGW